MLAIGGVWLGEGRHRRLGGRGSLMAKIAPIILTIMIAMVVTKLPVVIENYNDIDNKVEQR